MVCNFEGCDKQSSFGLPGGQGRFCAKHKTSEMINVKNKRCEHEGCDKRPNFGLKGERAMFCASHKTPEMIDVRHKMCEHGGCDTRANYDLPGFKGRFCATHKTTGMIDVKNKRCEYEGCDKLPAFDLPGFKGRFCVVHKTSEMIDVKNKRCEYEGCDKQPTFDLPGCKGRFCVVHKTCDMIDVSHKKCKHEGCDTRANYGKPGLSQSHCAKHRKPGMITRPNSKCAECREPAVWGTNWVPKHCEKHKTEDDENLVERACVSCKLVFILDKNDKCEYCNPESWATARLAKQNALMDYLDARDLKGTSTDTVVDGGECGKERPDRVYDFGDKIVILECDEHQHRDRACLCEQTRMINLGQTFGGAPVYFIRWNPDNYNSKKIPEILSKRHKLCGDFISDIKNNKIELPKALVSVFYMYYDGWTSLANENWEILSKYVSQINTGTLEYL
jgi:hypothetical protein